MNRIVSRVLNHYFAVRNTGIRLFSGSKDVPPFDMNMDVFKDPAMQSIMSKLKGNEDFMNKRQDLMNRMVECGAIDPRFPDRPPNMSALIRDPKLLSSLKNLSKILTDSGLTAAEISTLFTKLTPGKKN